MVIGDPRVLNSMLPPHGFVYMCLCVCACIRAYRCLCVCVCVCVCACLSVCLSVRLSVTVCVSLCVLMPVCMLMPVCLFLPVCMFLPVCLRACVCVCVYMYIYDLFNYIEAKDDFLLFVQSGALKRLSVPYRSKHFGYLHTAYGDNLIGTDFDCKEKFAYYTDATRGEIGRVTYNGLNQKVIIKGLKFPEGLYYKLIC